MAESKDHHEERMRVLRERLYSRGKPPEPAERLTLHDVEQKVPTSWGASPEPRVETPAVPVEAPAPQAHAPLIPMAKKKNTYRRLLLTGGLIFFLVALVLSGSLLFWKRNIISGDNITLETSGPFAVGGGQELPLKITIANNNTVAIESATLIIEYPLGTQSADEKGKELYRERRELSSIKPGETLNVEAKARVFGEENEEKLVQTSIEYRVNGSNAIFYKEAPELRFKISSSPVSLKVNNVTKGASGQDVELELEVSSNSPAPLANVLVKAEYPFGFDFVDSTPKPISGRDTWRIASLDPEETEKISVRGVISGKETETRTFKFSVGVPNERDQYSLASIFMTQSEEVNIERPFLDVKIGVNQNFDTEAVVTPGSVANITIVFTNNLSETLYDGKITADLSGNGLSPSQVRTVSGFFDSSTSIISWDSQGVPSLKSLAPGRSSTVNFDLTPRVGTGGADRTPQITLTANAEGNRVLDTSAQQKLNGIATKIVKVESVAKFTSKILYGGSEFTNTGPIPPEAEEVTTYSVVWNVKNGTNAITDGVVTATIPQYVAWLDLSTAKPVFSYNPQTRQISWKLGDLGANEERSAVFQISFKPSQSQIGQTPTIVNEQHLKATDRFTGTVIQASASALTTQLFKDPQFGNEEGRVQPKN